MYKHARVATLRLMLLTGFSAFFITSLANAGVLDFYVGRAIGRSNIREESSTVGNFSDRQNSWAIRAGIKPLPILGAELNTPILVKRISVQPDCKLRMSMLVRAQALFMQWYIFPIQYQH